MRRRLYHGTDREFEEFQFAGLGVHFGTKEQAIDRMESRYHRERGRIVVANVCIKNPLRMDDVHLWQLPKFVVPGLLNTGLWTEEDVGHIPRDPNDPPEVALSGLAMIKELIVAKGFDGIVYGNVGEGKRVKDSFVAFEPHQVAILSHGRELPLAGRQNGHGCASVSCQARRL